MEVLRRLSGVSEQAALEDVATAVVRAMPAVQAGAAGGETDFPELATLSDEELDALIDSLVDEENRLLYKHGALQGKLEILRAQRDHRRKRQPDPGSPE